MRNRKGSHTAYNYARGDGWILVANDHDQRAEVPGGHEHALVLYYADEQVVETHRVKNAHGRDGVDSFLRSFLDIGGKVGEYPGASPTADLVYEDQPRAVRMQRHATDIYRATEGARGMSPTIAIRAAETFGSKWAEKDADEWADRVQYVGEGRAERITAQL